MTGYRREQEGLSTPGNKREAPAFPREAFESLGKSGSNPVLFKVASFIRHPMVIREDTRTVGFTAYRYCTTPALTDKSTDYRKNNWCLAMDPLFARLHGFSFKFAI